MKQELADGVGRRLTDQIIQQYLQQKRDGGCKETRYRSLRLSLRSVYEWTPEGQLLTREHLEAWRESLREAGYASATVLNYVKGINLFLTDMGWEELKFRRGHSYDLTGRTFGWLEVMEESGEKRRANKVWRCRCRCGNIVEVPATQLVSGNNKSCGCIKEEILQRAQQYIDDTSLKQVFSDKLPSNNTSGHKGVFPRRGKWGAVITYKKKRYYLGTYARIEDAVRARKEAENLIRSDAEDLAEAYRLIHVSDAPVPTREDCQMQSGQKTEEEKGKRRRAALRNDNKSGCTGVSRHRDKWKAKITYQGRTYQLGHYDVLEDAVRARRSAEESLKKDPQLFLAGRQSHNPIKQEDIRNEMCSNK